MESLVGKSLEKASTQGFKSIAFPALGTGKLGFPADVSAGLMFDTAARFLGENSGTSVKTIKFVIHYNDTAVKKVHTLGYRT